MELAITFDDDNKNYFEKEKYWGEFLWELGDKVKSLKATGGAIFLWCQACNDIKSLGG